MTALRHRALVGARWTGTATLFSAVLQFAQLAVLARLLHPGDFGQMALVTLVVGFAHAYADAGMTGAIISKQDISDDSLSSLLWLSVACGAAIFLLLMASAPLIAGALNDAALEPLVRLSAWSFLITPAGQQFYAVLQKGLEFPRLAAIDIFASLTGAAVAIGLAVTGRGVYSLVWGFLASASLRSLALIAGGLPLWRPALRFRPTALRGFIRFGVLQISEKSINFVGFNVDKVLIGSLIGVHGLGLYNVAYQLVMRPMQVVTPVVNRVALPIYARVQNDDARLRSGFLDSARALALALFPAYMALIVLAEPVVVVLLGDRWTAAVPVVRLLSVLGFFYSVGNPMGALIIAKGRPGISFLLNIWMIVLYGLAVALGSARGVEGVAAGLAIATAAGLFPVGFAVRWIVVGMRPREYLGAIAPALIGSLVMAVCIVAARTILPSTLGALRELLALALVGGVAYLIVVLPWQRAFIYRVASAPR